MDKEKLSMLKNNGFKNTTVSEFLNLTSEESQEVENMMYYNTIKNNILKKISDNEYLLYHPNYGRMSSTRIIFNEDGIIVLGDFCPCRHGVISDFKYGLDWFLNTRDITLASKFLEKSFQPELGQRILRNYAKQNYDSDENCRNLYDDIKTGFVEIFGIIEFDDALNHYLEDDDHDWFYEQSLGYNKHDYGMLNAIHKKFKEEYDF